MVAFATVALCAIAANYIYVQKTPPAAPVNVVQTVKQPDLKPPTTADVLSALFGVKIKADNFISSENKRSSVWFGQLLTHDKGLFYAVFIKTQTIDTDSQALLSSHADSANVSTLMYQLNAGQWQLLSKQMNLSSFGSWGDVPDMQQAQILSLSANKVVFLIDNGFTSQGYSEEGKGLISYNFATHTWKDLGFIQTAGNNAGVCDDAPQSADSMLSACWEFTGEITVSKQVSDSDYPDLLVLHKGTTTDSENKIVAIANHLYAFDGSFYTQRKQISR